MSEKISRTAHYISTKTADNMQPEMFERRDKFVEGLLLGMTKKNAALYAGVPLRSAAKEGSQLWLEPYVQQLFRELREKVDEEKLITRKELLLNLKSLAFDDTQSGVVRVAASSALARICGFEAEKTPKVAERVSGVMEVPLVVDAETWESVASTSQEQLKQDVRN